MKESTRKGKTLLKGHTLIGEGMVVDLYTRLGEGIGGCSCGDRSPSLPSCAARKRWHAEHKLAISPQQKGN